MSIRKSLFYFCVSLIFLFSYSARASDKDEKYDWMNQTYDGLKTWFQACLETPSPGDSIQEGNTYLNLENPDVWVSTGKYVMKDKAIRFDWSTLGATAANSRKYRILYRVDPRFDRPQVFIKEYNPKTKKYEAVGFPKFNTTDPDKDYPNIAFNKMQDYVDYISFKNRKKICVEKGDVINITLGSSGDFFGVATEDNLISQELGDTEGSASMLHTKSGMDNKIIYSNTRAFCKELSSGSSYLCVDKPNFNYSKLCLVGNPALSVELNMLNKRPSCPSAANGKDNDPLCFYDQGRGMKITVGGHVIKKESESFVYSPLMSKSFLYYKSDTGGDLDFITDWSIQNIFYSLSKPLMNDWIGGYSSLTNFYNWLNASPNNLRTNFLHFGRYIMIVEIGNGNEKLTTEQHQDIEVEYTIVKDDSMSPEIGRVGMPLSKDVSFDAYESGYIWLKVKNPNPEVKGSINVNYANYTGTTWFSDIIYTGVVKPITDQFHKFTADFYRKLVRNSSLQRIGRLALVLYICIYGLTFLAGATQITAKDLVIRIFKITIIVILLGDTSWEFFNKYLFNAYIKGTDYLMTNIVGLTGTKSNIFGFIDPIFDKYTDGRFWLLLFIELLQIHNGLTFVAIITIYSLLLYFRAILEVIVSYVIAYVGLSVMISLAPFFIILMLFEKTKSIFDNWLSTLFSYVIQPTILLIFFLLIDQLMYQQITKIVVRACWGVLIPIRIGLDLSHLDLPINFSFPLWFFLGIPFFIPRITEISNIDNINAPGTFLIVFSSALLFYLFSKMAHGIVDYVTTVSSMLTNVSPARQEGKFQKRDNPASGIVSDITDAGKFVAKPVTVPVTRVAKVFKDKVIDQNYMAKQDDDKKEYTKKILASRNDKE
ncbi:MAG: type IV secretion system protein [Candidatus Rickettsia vulgarisii]